MLAAGSAQEAAAAKRFHSRRAEAGAAVDRLGRVEAQVESLERPVNAMRKTIENEKTILGGAEPKLRAELQAADQSYYDHLFSEHLQKYVIARASIPDIGPSRSAALASFGVETAGDVSRSAIYRIPGFGRHLTGRMMIWRRQCEQSFPHGGPLKAPTSWADQIRRRHAKKVLDAATRLRRALSDFRGTFDLNNRRFDHAAAQLDEARAACRVR